MFILVRNKFLFITGYLSLQAPVQFESELEMQRLARNIPVGTMAFTLITEALYLRVSQGWRSISVSVQLDCFRIR